VLAHAGWGDDFNRADEIVRYEEQRRLLYAFDYTPNFSLPNDIGNYWEDADELRTPGYAGFSLLFADEATDARPQPSTVFWTQILNNENRLTSTSAQHKVCTTYCPVPINRFRRMKKIFSHRLCCWPADRTRYLRGDR
jgi:hypothetical protein